MAYDKKYSDKECEDMIENMSYPVDAPPFVIKAIKEKRKNIERKIKRPQKEMNDFMKELGGSKRDDKNR